MKKEKLFFDIYIFALFNFGAGFFIIKGNREEDLIYFLIANIIIFYFYLRHYHRYNKKVYEIFDEVTKNIKNNK